MQDDSTSNQTPQESTNENGSQVHMSLRSYLLVATLLLVAVGMLFMLLARMQQVSVSEPVENTPITTQPSEINVMELTRDLLVFVEELPSGATIEDAEEYVTPPTGGSQQVYYCDGDFILQETGGEYHKLQFYSSSYEKTNECEASWNIGGPPVPDTCSVNTDQCNLAQDYVYPLTLSVDKESYQYGDTIRVELASNPNLNKTIVLDDIGVAYCGGIYLERIGSSSKDWIKDSIENPNSGEAGVLGMSCDAVTVSPELPFVLNVKIDDTGSVPSGKWRVVHESGHAYLTQGFWLEPEVKQTADTCEIGREYVNSAINPVSCVCPKWYEFTEISTVFIPCPTTTITHETMSACPKTTQVCYMAGYNTDRIVIQYKSGTDLSDPLSLFPEEVQNSIDPIPSLTDLPDHVTGFMVTVKAQSHQFEIIEMIRGLEWVESAQFELIPAPTP